MATDAVPPVHTLTLHDASASEVSKYPNCFPSINPMDKYRAHIAELVAQALGLDPLHVYPRVHWTNTLDKGDLVMPVESFLRFFFFFFLRIRAKIY